MMNKHLIFIIYFLITTITPANILALWPDDPAVNVPICTAEGTQEHPRIITDGESGAIIVWQDMSSASADIYAQRIDARGEIRWVKDGVPVCLEKGDQWTPNLVSDGEGGAIIAWWDKRAGDMDIYAQRINADGEALWRPGGIVVCNAPGYQQDFDITTDMQGGAIIVWHDYRSKTTSPDIYIQRINSKGQTLWEKNGVLISAQGKVQSYPAIASDKAGGAIVSWHEWRENDADIYAQRVDAKGKIMWQEGGAPVCQMPNHQWFASIASDGKGGAIVVWMDHRDSVNSDIYAQCLDPQGKILWQENGVPVCVALGDQYDYSILGDDAGGAFIVWQDHRGADWDIYMQKLDASGEIKWQKDGVPVCSEINNQYNPNLVSDDAGGIIISWWDKRDTDSDIYAQRVDAKGNFLWVEGGVAISIAPGNQQDAYPVNSGFGSAIIVWWDMRTMDADIYAQRVFSE